MTARTLIGLAVALIVLTVLAIYGQRGGDAPGGADVGRPLMPELESALDRVDRVAVVGGGNTPIATLLRREDRWVVAEKDEYPADVAKIRDVLRGLAEARIVERKTANPAYYDRLGVESVDAETASGVAITARAGDNDVAAVIVGDGAGSGYHYVRPLNQDTSFMVDRELEVPRNVAQWVDPTIVDVRGARVRQVEIQHPDGEIVRLSKADEQQTNFTVEVVPTGRELQYPGVANVIGNALRELRLEDVEASSSAADGQDPVRAIFRTFDGLLVAVEGSSRGDGGTWIELEARADATGPEAAEASPAADADTAAPTLDPASEANDINRRVAGWRYRIPSYQFDQMTRRLEDLLQAED
jgi:hypothetical protein